MKPKIIYFDTNLFYHIALDKIPKTNLDCFINHAEQERIKLFYTPITLVEIACHINRNEVDKFHYYQNVLKQVRSICNNNILDNPDHVLATILKAPSPKNMAKDNILELNQIRDLICDAKNYDQLIQGQNLCSGGMLLRVKCKEDAVKNFRTDCEANWISEMYEYVVNSVNPGYFEKLKKGRTPKVTDENLRKKLIKFLDSIKFKSAFIDACFFKAMNLPKDVLIGQISVKKVENLLKRISAYFTAYKTIIRKIIENGYNVQKNKNDLNDLHYLIYLGLGNHILFVTYDGGIREKIKGSTQQSQVTTIEEVIRGKQ